MSEASTLIKKTLTQVSWLNACGETPIAYLSAHATLDHVADGTTVAWRGRRMTHLLIPVRGTLELSITSAQGKRHIIPRHESEQVFGLIPVLDDSVAIHDAVARGACEIVRVPQATLRQAMQTFPALNDQIIYLLCARVRNIYQALATQALATQSVRLARALLIEIQRSSATTLSITQSELADVLGITRQSVNTELKRFERDGIVKIGRGWITIRNSKQLEQLASTSE